MGSPDVEITRDSSPGEGSYSDPEKTVGIETGESLKRHMSSRHLQFLAIGGTIGTGLFLGTGGDLSQAGPAACLIAYIFMGTVVYSVMASLGEMATFIPIAGAFTSYASRFVDPTLGFAMGWLYWFSWAMTYALELAAAAIVIQYWTESINPGIFIAVFWLIFTSLNFLPVKIFAESEMYFVSLKVVTIVGFIIFGICINAGAGREGYLGFKYWSNPGAFAEYSDQYTGDLGRFLSFLSVLIGASFSFQGSELVGVGAGEVGNPRRNVPRAIHGTFWGIFSLFVATVFFIGILVPSDDEALASGALDASASPLVIAAKRAGVKVLPDVINAVLLTAILSAANSNVYSGSRILVALANEGQAPAWVKRTNKRGTPYVAVAVTSVCGLLGFLKTSTVGSSIFSWLLNISGVAGLICWSCINLCHIRFMKALQAQGIDRSTLPYRAFLQPYLAWYGFVCTVVIALVQGFSAFLPWSTVDFFAAYISVILFLVLYIGHKVICRTRIVPLAGMNLIKGRVEE